MSDERDDRPKGPIDARLVRPPPGSTGQPPVGEAAEHLEQPGSKEPGPPPPESTRLPGAIAQPGDGGAGGEEEPVPAALVRPPPPGASGAGAGDEPRHARLIRPPHAGAAGPIGARPALPPGGPPGPPGARKSFGALLGDGLRAAARSPAVVAGLFVARGLGMLAWAAPLLLVYDAVTGALGERGDVFAAALALVSPATWLLPAGVFFACAVLAFALELLVWSGGLASLDRVIRREPGNSGTFLRAFGPAFPRIVIVAACMGAAWIAWTLFVWTLGGATGWTLLAGPQAAKVPAAAGLSLAAVVWLAGAIYLPVLYDLALARTGVLGEAPLVAIHGAAAHLGRRPFSFAGIGIVVGVLAGIAAGALVGPAQAAILSGGTAALVVAGALGRLLAVVVTAFAAVTRLGAFVSAIRET